MVWQQRWLLLVPLGAVFRLVLKGLKILYTRPSRLMLRKYATPPGRQISPRN